MTINPWKMDCYRFLRGLNLLLIKQRERERGRKIQVQVYLLPIDYIVCHRSPCFFSTLQALLKHCSSSVRSHTFFLTLKFEWKLHGEQCVRWTHCAIRTRFFLRIPFYGKLPRPILDQNFWCSHCALHSVHCSTTSESELQSLNLKVRSRRERKAAG